MVADTRLDRATMAAREIMAEVLAVIMTERRRMREWLGGGWRWLREDDVRVDTSENRSRHFAPRGCTIVM